MKRTVHLRDHALICAWAAALALHTPVLAQRSALTAPEARLLSGLQGDYLPYQVGIYFGFMLALLSYNLYRLFSLKEVKHLYLVLILAGLLLHQVNHKSFAGLTFISPSDQQVIQGFTLALLFSLITLWTGSFFEIKTRLPQLRPFLLLIVGVWVGIACVVPMLSPNTAFILCLVWITATMVFALVASILSWIHADRRPALFFLVAWIGLLIGFSGDAFIQFGISPFNRIGEYGFWLGFAWMGVFWSIALADGAHTRQAETDRINREMQKRYRHLTQTFEALPVGVMIFGPDQKWNCLNPLALKFTATRVLDSEQAVPLDGLPIAQAFEGQSSWVDNIEVDLIDERVSLQAGASPVHNEQGKVESVVVVLQDITQRKKDEAELKENRRHLEQQLEERTAQLRASSLRVRAEITERQRLEDGFRVRLEWLVATNIANNAVVRASDLSQIFQNLSAIIQKLFSAADAFISEREETYNEITIRTRAVSDGTHPDWLGTVVEYPTDIRFQRILTQRDQVIIQRDQFGILGSDLNEKLQTTEFQSIMLAPLMSQKKTIGLLGMVYHEAERLFSANEIMLITSVCADIVQITESARLFEQTQAVIATEERNRLARDLHDSVTQVLFAANLVAEVLPQIWRRDTVQAFSSLEELRRLIRSALAEMRTLLIDLRPAALIKTPLNDLITQLTEVVAGRINLQVKLFIEQIPPLPEDVHIGFYRIAQESLNNIVKHAFADQAELSLSAIPLNIDSDPPVGSEVKLVVRDNGRGFIPEEKGPQQMGHVIMYERAAAINASLTVESERGKGTTVTLIWPGESKGL